MCLTPDAHTAALTRGQRNLLGTCHRARQRALGSLNILTLFRLDPVSRTSTEYRVPFDFAKTCLCIDGWQGQAINAEQSGMVRGLEFAKNIQRLAFVVSDDNIREYTTVRTRIGQISPRDLQRLALLFHNAVHVAGIGESASEIKMLLG